MPGRIWKRWVSWVAPKANQFSFYVQVIPIGEKPAARAVAVGARLVRDPDGSVGYTWEADEKQAVKSPPAPAAPDASDGNLVNSGIEKAKNNDLDGAIADFNGATELNPKDDAPYYDNVLATRPNDVTTFTIADCTKAIKLGSTNTADLTRSRQYRRAQKINIVTAQLLTIRAPSN